MFLNLYTFLFFHASLLQLPKMHQIYISGVNIHEVGYPFVLDNCLETGVEDRVPSEKRMSIAYTTRTGSSLRTRKYEHERRKL